MGCDAWSERLIDRLAGELGEEESVVLEQHLDECADCREEERRLRALLATQGPDVDWMPSHGILPRLLERMRHEAAALSKPHTEINLSKNLLTGRGSAGMFGFLRRPLPSFATLALVLLAMAGGIWIGRTDRAERLAEAPGPVPAERIRPDRLGSDAPVATSPAHTKEPVRLESQPMVASSFLDEIRFIPAQADAMGLSASVGSDSL